MFESSEKESSKPFKERLKEEATIPFHLYKGAVQGGLKLLESGSGLNGIKTSLQDLHQINTNRTQFEQNKKQQKEAFIEFGKETVQYGKEFYQDHRKKLHELWDGVTHTASQKAVDFIKLPRKEQAEIVGSLAPDVAFSALGIEEAAMLTQGEKVAAALVKENPASEKIKASIFLKFDRERKVWTTPAGLEYGVDRKYGTHVKHVLAHLKPDPNKKMHTVFNVEKQKLLPLIDEAWLKRADPIPAKSRNIDVYRVNMNRIVGTQGETDAQIVVYKNTNRVISSYLWKEK